MLHEKDIGSSSMDIDVKKAHYPCCIVWTPLPLISWLIPFIGHIGICREDGVILDFAGPYFISVDNFAFGAVARYVPLNKDQCCSFSYTTRGISQHVEELSQQGFEHGWDDILRLSMQDFQHRTYNLFTCNCHSFVANVMNKMSYNGSGGWNVVNLAVYILFKGRWVNKCAVVRSFLPFVVVVSLGVVFGGWKFVTGLAAFACVLVGWFLFGTYCCKNLIEL